MAILEAIHRLRPHIEEQSPLDINAAVGQRLEDINQRKQELQRLWQDSVLTGAFEGIDFEANIEHCACLWSKIQECDVLRQRVYTEIIRPPYRYLVFGGLRLRLPCF